MHSSKTVGQLIDSAHIVDFEKHRACGEVLGQCSECEWHVHSKDYCELETAYNALCNIIYFNTPHKAHNRG